MPTALIIPVKALSDSKRRLALPAQGRKDVARRLMLHTVSVAATTAELDIVAVVTPDREVAMAVGPLGAVVIPEPTEGGLVPALVAARRTCRRLAPRHDLAIMVSDLPGLTHGDVKALLAELRARETPLMVADHHGTGTTALIHPHDVDPPILFGARSARRHRAAGYAEATGPLRGLRRDLDTAADLSGSPELLQMSGADLSSSEPTALSLVPAPRQGRNP